MSASDLRKSKPVLVTLVSIRGLVAPGAVGFSHTRLQIQGPTPPCGATSDRKAGGSPAVHRAWPADP